LTGLKPCCHMLSPRSQQASRLLSPLHGFSTSKRAESNGQHPPPLALVSAAFHSRSCSSRSAYSPPLQASSITSSCAVLAVHSRGQRAGPLPAPPRSPCCRSPV